MLSSDTESKATDITHHIDMQGYEGCLFIAVGTSEMTKGSGSTQARASVQGCSSTTLTSFTSYMGSGTTRSALLIGTGTAIVAGGRLHKIPFVIDLYRPLKRYARIVRHGLTTGGVNWIGLLYGGKKTGTTAVWGGTVGAGDTGRTVVKTTVLVSPVT